jgi:hypothetical protein
MLYDKSNFENVSDKFLDDLTKNILENTEGVL